MTSTNQWASKWQLDPTLAYLNHGSYGSVPIDVQQVQDGFRLQATRDPNRWFRFELPGLLDDARDTVAKWFGVPTQHFAFVPNASQGVITAVQALVNQCSLVQATPHLVATSLGYGGVLHGLEHIAKFSKCNYSIAQLVYPTEIDADVIAERINASIADKKSNVIVVLDHITSETGVLLPVSDVISLVRAKHPSAQFVIDAAHSAGMLQQPLPIGFDVWVGNLHKWLCAPQPAAALICGSQAIANVMAPLSPSWGYEKGFPGSFEWQGTSDYSAYLSVPSAIAFQEQWSWAERDFHNRSVVDSGAALLRSAWGTQPHIDSGVEAPWMRMVQLPLIQPWTKTEIETVVQKAGKQLKAECMCMTVREKTYVRISAHMYNEADQYEALTTLPQLLA